MFYRVIVIHNLVRAERSLKNIYYFYRNDSFLEKFYNFKDELSL